MLGGDPDPVLRLGAALVAQLELDDRADVLTRWMAHYVAECMTEAKAARGKPAAAAAAKHCQEAILALWEHRAELPAGVRPLAALEPLEAVVQALDPDRAQPFVHRRIWEALEGDPGQPADAFADVRTAERGARLLIGELLREAAADAVDASAAWVELANGARRDGNDLRIILRLGGETDDDKDERERQARLRTLRDRQEALAVMASRANTLAERYAKEIAELEAGG